MAVIFSHGIQRTKDLLMAMENRSPFIFGLVGVGAVFVAFTVWLFSMAVAPETFAAKQTSVKKPLERAFPSSEKCKRCHLRAFEEWEASAQSRSIVTAPFRITLERYLAKADKKDQAMCFQCHAPHIAEYGELLPRFIKEVQSKDPHMDGVGCPQCHLIHEVDDKVHPPCTDFSIGQNHFWGL